MENMPAKFEFDVPTILKFLGLGSAFLMIVVIIMIVGVNLLHSEQGMSGENVQFAAFFV